MRGADPFYDTSLQNVHGQFGANTAVTTTDGSGTRTTVTGNGGSSGDRASGTAVSSVSFDFYRSSASTTDPNLAPVLRFDMLKNGAFAGSLVFENVYQTQQASPVDSWTTLTANLNSGIFWATNAALGPTFASANGGQKTLTQWIADNAGANLTVYGLEIGIGSGWSGSFSGAVNNVQANFAGRTVSTNFEVTPAAAAVPEPAAWTMMIAGFGLAGMAMRRRQVIGRVHA
ncbi:PEPxxWA-CTERM sorting domain-containing protein [uncultured Sphingomonas sp.]|uniref:PEPxxWA-CTERM sorting domain-containing protein n=1 Tax=uncultured Sphingomonas sp. TaxID=158754 RepID=UPI0035C9EE0D